MKQALLRFGVQVILAKALQYASDMDLMIFQGVGEYEDIIEVDHYEDISHVSEDVIHEGLEHCIGSPQLWTDMSCSQAGPLTLG